MSDAPATSSHARLYWAYRHTSEWLMDALRHHRPLLVKILCALVLTIWFSRVAIHPYVIILRTHIALILIMAALPAIGWIVVRKRSWIPKTVMLIATGLMILIVVSDTGRDFHRYMSLWSQYQQLSVVEIDELFESDDERYYPRHAIYSRAVEIMQENHQMPTIPAVVRMRSQNYWTMAVEPEPFLLRLFGEVQHLISIPVNTVAPDFSHKIPVRFDISPSLLLSHNTQGAVTRKFGLWRYLNYEPSDVIFVRNDQGEFVQIVSLIRWRGFIFPRREFGGVVIISQRNDKNILHAVTSTIERIMIGRGTWIRPKDIHQYAFLIGQDTLPFAVSRFQAESFRFQEGIKGPLPGFRKGDIRIPDMPGDMNQQPFTETFINAKNRVAELYHYYGLEPYSAEKRALNTSLFFPADGTRVVYVLRHYKNEDRSPIGVSAIAAKVRDDKKDYKWDETRPVEHRPYFKRIHGRVRPAFLTTVITLAEKHGKFFVASTVPELAITDAEYPKPVWVDTLHPDTWIPQIEKTLEPFFAAEKKRASSE
ncbi:MAG: hypothetical protein Q8R40_03695 [bacterium]|nr:hypothetical protein [bacterium]